jgi:hypothetical protein
MASAPAAPDPEALDWLRQDPPPAGVWIHKALEPVDVAIRLVETLYALGARRVTVPGWAVSVYQHGQRAGELTACGFEVSLPEAGPEREALIWSCATECGRPTWGPLVPLEVFRSRVGCKTVELAWV